jgi:hypothetical protein
MRTYHVVFNTYFGDLQHPIIMAMERQVEGIFDPAKVLRDLKDVVNKPVSILMWFDITDAVRARNTTPEVSDLDLL